ncbi:MAG: lantibiotic dehydratase C-terminal domain-containing protein [Saprospiraceae bacterium]
MTGTLTATTWVAVHLHYSEPWEQFLAQAIKPYISTVVATGIVEHYNFLRYWDRGPHIRLRFKGNQKVLKQLLLPNLEKHFLNYYEQHPSHLSMPNYPSDFPIRLRWLPNNSIQYDAFQMPTHRLGGERFAKVAEQQFQASSDIILHLLSLRPTLWDSDEAILAAAKLHLSMFFAVGMQRVDIYNFMEQYFRNWLRNAPNFTPRSRRNPQFEVGYREQLLQEFKRDFSKHRFFLRPQINEFWNCLREDCNAKDEQLNEWIDFNQAANFILKTYYNGRFSYATTPIAFTNLFGEFVHQTNNRLGIHDVNEGYLMYMLMRVAEEMEEASYFG